jgi:hypothetical protein
MYHFVVFTTHFTQKAIFKNINTVISAITSVEFISENIGLKYSKTIGWIEDQTQSIINQNKFQNSTIKNIQTTSGKYFLANSLSQPKEVTRYQSKNDTIFIKNSFNLDFGLLRAFFQRILTTKTIIKNANVVILTFVIGHQTCSHWSVGICGLETIVSTATWVLFSIIFRYFCYNLL